MSAGVSVAGTVVHFGEALTLMGVSRVTLFLSGVTLDSALTLINM